MFLGPRSLRVHACYSLNRLVRSKHFPESKCMESLEILRNEPYQAKFATGKETALTLYSLGEVPDAIKQSRDFKEIACTFVERAIKILRSSMNEKSIAVAAVGVSRLNGSLETENMVRFIEALEGAVKLRPIKFPRNISNIAYTVANMRSCPLKFRAKALNGWLADAIMSIDIPFHVPDIVQLVSAYSVCGVTHQEVLNRLETASLSQVQYMDGLSLGAVMSGFSKLRYLPSQNFADTWLATLAQCASTMNAQSICCALFGVSFWSTKGLSLDKSAIDAIVLRLPNIFDFIPLRSLCVALQAFRQCKGSFDPHLIEEKMESVIRGIRKEEPWLVVELGETFLSLLNDSPSVIVFTEEVIHPILTRSFDVDTRTLARLVGIYAKVIRSADMALIRVCAEDIKRRGNVKDYALLIKGLSQLADSEPILIESIVESALRMPDWEKVLGLDSRIQFALDVWTATGAVDCRILSRISLGDPDISQEQREKVEWLFSPSLTLPVLAKVVSIDGENLVPSRMFKPPFPGSICSNSSTDELMRRIDSFDPYFRILNPRVGFWLTATAKPSRTDVAHACMRAKTKGTTEVFVPLPVTEDTVYTLLKQFNSS